MVASPKTTKTRIHKNVLADKPEKFVFTRKYGIFAGEIKRKDSGRSAVRLAHLLWEQGVAGSSPATPTMKIKYLRKRRYLFHL